MAHDSALEAFITAVRAEAVAEERQRIAAGIRDLPLMTDRGGDLIPKAAEQVRVDAALLAAGSVPVATPSAPECEHGMRWPHRYLPVPSSSPCPGPVATPVEPEHNHEGGPCGRCDELNLRDGELYRVGQPTAAEPSVGTGTPAEPPTFEQLLRDPMEQFDRRSELLPAILRHLCNPDVGALLRSIEEYRNAPPAAATSASSRPPHHSEDGEQG